jgi:hypothetical protein
MSENHDTDDVLDFHQMLSSPIGSWEEQVTPPVGHYKGEITRMEVLRSNVKKTLYVCFYTQLLLPQADISPAAMEGVSLRDWEVPNRPGMFGDVNNFYITPGTRVVFRRFLESCGCGVETLGTDFLKANDNLRGFPVLIGIGHTEGEGNNKGRIFLNIADFAGFPAT